MYLADGHSGVRQAVSLAGAVLLAQRFDAYGVTVASAGTLANVIGYRGERFDSTLGQYYLRARFYNPMSGRFTGMDPFAGNYGDPLQAMRYGYAGANPVGAMDPSGMFFGTTLGVFFGAAIRTGHVVVYGGILATMGLSYGGYKFATRRRDSITVRIHTNLRHSPTAPENRITPRAETEIKRIFDDAIRRLASPSAKLTIEWIDHPTAQDAMLYGELGQHYGLFSGYSHDVAMVDTNIEYAQSLMGGIGNSIDAIGFTVDHTGHLITGKIATEATIRKIPADIQVARTVAHEIGHHAIGGRAGLMSALDQDSHPHVIGFIDARRGPNLNQANPVFSNEGAAEFIDGLNISKR